MDRPQARVFYKLLRTHYHQLRVHDLTQHPMTALRVSELKSLLLACFGSYSPVPPGFDFTTDQFQGWLKLQFKRLVQFHKDLIRSIELGLAGMPTSDWSKDWEMAVSWARRDLVGLDPELLAWTHSEITIHWASDASFSHSCPIGAPESPRRGQEHLIPLDPPMDLASYPQPEPVTAAHPAEEPMDVWPPGLPYWHSPTFPEDLTAQSLAPEPVQTVTHRKCTMKRKHIDRIQGATCHGDQLDLPLSGKARPAPPLLPRRVTAEARRTPPIPMRGPLFEIHHHLGNREKNWSLKPQNQIIIVGDSNLKHLPPMVNPLVQVACYPGARLQHAVYLLGRSTPVSPEVRLAVLSFGLNDNMVNEPRRNRAQLLSMVHRARIAFPAATIWVPEVNYSDMLTHRMTTALSNLNCDIRNLMHFIPSLPRDSLSVNKWDPIHWSKEGGRMVWEHWARHLGI